MWFDMIDLNKDVNVNNIIEIAQQAGKIILSIYNQTDFEVSHKTDHSPLTQADLLAHEFIYNKLKQYYPTIPILSEESTEYQKYENRKQWKYFFLVDPLDGTKEFIQHKGEFTINIALINNDSPLLGVLHAPVFNQTYYAERHKGSFKIENNKLSKLLTNTHKKLNDICVIVSRSHCCQNTQAFLQTLQNQNYNIKTLSIGSALKFARIAEGAADVYPRFSPTMEWDTAAGHLIVEEAGKQLSLIGSDQKLLYNKTSLVNPGFIVGSAETIRRFASSHLSA